MPDTEYFAPCMKSMPASIRTVPGGMMSTSSVNRGRCCAPPIPAKHVSKIRIITMRVICERILRQDYGIHKIFKIKSCQSCKSCESCRKDPVFFCAKGNQLCHALQFCFSPSFVSQVTRLLNKTRSKYKESKLV